MSIEELRGVFEREIRDVKNAKSLEALRIKFLGREQGELTKILRSLKDRSPEERRNLGARANVLRRDIEEGIERKLADFEHEVATGSVDLTRPGEKVRHGHLHPLTHVGQEVIRIFRSLNFSVLEGPEVETEYYNFDALNIPPNHPAREMWDTFWLKETRDKGQETGDKKTVSHVSGRMLLRTHTSPMQIRYMEAHNPPFQILVPGRVYRYEATDATHETNFGQFEGLMVGKDISIANFKYVIETFFDKFFGRKVEFRYRPSFFPFVEPGWEVDLKLGSRWVEMMGAGMVHPKVFENVGYNPREWTGFAFGMALERLAMVKYKIPDIRLFYSGDLRFIQQF